MPAIAETIYTTCPLQEAILERAYQDGTEEEFRDSLHDLASGHDPIYQFVGFIPTEGIILDIYREYKADIIEAIAELASYCDSWCRDRAVRETIAWQLQAGHQWRDVPATHADFAARCLKIALDYHAGELARQLDQ